MPEVGKTVPAGQAEQEVAPGGATKPEGQGRHDACATALLKNPAKHVVHADWPTPAYEPAAQLLQTEAPSALLVPLAHHEHVVAKAAANRPREQNTGYAAGFGHPEPAGHAFKVPARQKYPDGQDMHTEEALGKKVPAPHELAGAMRRRRWPRASTT